MLPADAWEVQVREARWFSVSRKKIGEVGCRSRRERESERDKDASTSPDTAVLHPSAYPPCTRMRGVFPKVDVCTLQASGFYVVPL